MLKKTIQINPELFNIGNKKKKRDKKKKKLNPFSSALKPNDIKKQLIQRVKDHHKKKRRTSNRKRTGATRKNIYK